MANTLYIATQRNYSSWSLRPWLVLRWAGVKFDEVEVDLAQPGYGQAQISGVKAVSPNGLVPALHVDGTVIWDTLAIAEWVAEQVPALWPRDAMARAQARAATAEMHSGFTAIRRDMSMNILRRWTAPALATDTQANLDRLFELWRDCRSKHGADGPWLFGERSIADAFYLPIATRLRTYGIALDPICQVWCDTALADTDFLHWESLCVPESWDRPGYAVIDGLYR